MCGYEILLNLPKHQMFSLWNKSDIKAFYKWFMAEKDNRLQMLFDEIHRDPEFANWEPDFSPKSLKILGKWYISKVSADTNFQYPQFSKYIISLSYDLSIYYGEVILKSLGDRQWKLNINTSVNNLSYGCMVIPRVNKYNLCITPWTNIGVFTLRIKESIVEDDWLYFLYINIMEDIKTHDNVLQQ